MRTKQAVLRVHAIFRFLAFLHWFLRGRIRIMHKWQNAQNAMNPTSDAIFLIERGF